MPENKEKSDDPAFVCQDEEFLTGSADRAGWLWSPPTKQTPNPPVQTRIMDLPVGDLEWENAERLFMRVLASVGEIQWAKLYGKRGQDQDGIDAYARMRISSSSSQASRPYVVLQSRRVKQLGGADIDAAIADFLEGSWPRNTNKYILATTYDLTETRLDAALRRAADALAQHNIEFEPWGAVEVNTLLKARPELVDDFFGRAWVEPFCGPEDWSNSDIGSNGSMLSLYATSSLRTTGQFSPHRTPSRAFRTTSSTTSRSLAHP